MKKIFLGLFASLLLTACAAYAPQAAAQTKTWQEAYAELLRDYAEQKQDNLMFFILHDIDMDGVPELIIAGEYADEIYDAAYVFRNGKAMPLKFDEGVYIAGFALSARAGVVPNPNNAPGLTTYIRGAAGQFGSDALYWRVVIDGDRLIIDTRGEIRVDLTTGYTHFYIENTTATEEDFFRVFGRWEWLPYFRITEDNINEVIFGG